MADNYLDGLAGEIGALLPGCPEELVPFYALLAAAKGEAVTPEDVHDAWSLWKAPMEPDHWFLIPFADLPPEIQEFDVAPCEAIRLAASRYRE